MFSIKDPWGFVGKPDLSTRPLWQRSLLRVFGKVPPLGIVRTSGPFGEWLIRRARRDIMQKYDDVVDDSSIIARYIHQCNTDNPTGEYAFKRLLLGGPWARYPIGERMKENFPSQIPVTFIYGDKSWMNNSYGIIIKESRNSYTHIEYVENAGHHVYADNSNDFNKYVNNACNILKTKAQSF
jgi:pimeloyl-ACP methyl ester carboxylesterase